MPDFLADSAFSHHALALEILGAPESHSTSTKQRLRGAGYGRGDRRYPGWGKLRAEGSASDRGDASDGFRENIR